MHHLPTIPRRKTAALGLAALVLPVLLNRAPAAPAQQPPEDLPAAATRMAAMYGTADARLNTCRSQHEACFVALQTTAAKVYAVQTAVAP